MPEMPEMSEMSDTDESTDNELSDMKITFQSKKPERIDMQKMPILIKDFDSDIIDEAHQKYEKAPYGHLREITELIDKEETEKAGKYKELLKIIARCKLQRKLPDSDETTKQLVDDIKTLTDATDNEALSFLEIEEKAISDFIFDISSDEWNLFIQTGKAWNKDHQLPRKRQKLGAQQQLQYHTP